jgi:SAM-dependent methyltransferase
MALIDETAKFLCEARASGVSFERVATLARQSSYVTDAALESLGARYGVAPEGRSASKNEYSDMFFKWYLGTRDLVSIDNSNYQHASILHDLNKPIETGLEEKFDVVIDGGTLEHVFNFPVAIANCMRMLRVGGRLFLFTPCNNQLGHGFYQFSPELFYRVLSSTYGFEVDRMFAMQFSYTNVELGAHGKRYSVRDPLALRERVTLVNSRPAILMIEARKTRHVSKLFDEAPQQSDYAEMWAAAEGTTAETVPSSRRLPSRLTQLLPPRLRAKLRQEYYRFFVHSFRNKAFYETVTKGNSPNGRM